MLREYVQDERLIEQTQSRMIRNRKSAEQLQIDEQSFQLARQLVAQRRHDEAIHLMVTAQRLDDAVETAASVLNSLYKNLANASEVVKYFTIVDTIQQVSLQRLDQPLKELVLFHCLHASIYLAVWHGLFDTLEVIG